MPWRRRACCCRTWSPAQPEGPPVTRRELEILQLVAEGMSNKEIGKSLSITEGTVKNHVHNALEKLHMENRIQATAYIVRQATQCEFGCVRFNTGLVGVWSWGCGGGYRTKWGEARATGEGEAVAHDK